jgi:hypothetical protein
MRIYAWHNSILFVPSISEDAAALLAKCIAMLYNSGRSVKYLEEMAQTVQTSVNVPSFHLKQGDLPTVKRKGERPNVVAGVCNTGSKIDTNT